MKYECHDCNMTVRGITCDKCGVELENAHIKKDGKTIQVCKCKKCHGMIKSPQCCGSDMCPNTH